MKNNYHQYHITNTGKISLNGKPHKTKVNKDGHVIAYLSIKTSLDSMRKGKTIRVGKVVCQIYKDVPKNHEAVVFLDGDKTNITLDNMMTSTAVAAGKHNSKPKPEIKEVSLDISRISWR